jgi:hypothetical protein
MRLVVVALVALLVPSAAVGRHGTFPCRWKWDLQAGLRTGYVTAGDSADCAGRQGSLTLSVRLLRWNPKTRKWHTDKAQTRAFKDLRANRYVTVDERCRASTVRAEFGWILRDPGGTAVSRNSIRTATLKVPGPDCRIGIR